MERRVIEMLAPEAALQTVKDSWRAMTLEILNGRISSLTRELDRTKRRCKTREKALRETRRDILSTVLTQEHYEALLSLCEQLGGCSRYATEDAICNQCNGPELSSILTACADAARRLHHAFMSVGVTMPESPPSPGVERHRRRSSRRARRWCPQRRSLRQRTRPPPR